ncbi:kinase-like domain-containing protein [Cantharellus anzutake]|uniref:kinase-like domain-containing protein n=1 Tax=Cantharellus anzutake TaxID=1750568 RepID=UPI0019045406|nr:kinase-like domain-containing protein [Cantharellus anzutake]KAF8333998.1 kinase-like domain-containing protein [Cantharellus anzutake]
MSGSHALLLRLFQSQSYFSVHLALQYLSIYYNHIGITHYLAGRLREIDATELDDVWGFVCHLLVTRPSKSCALETFIIERAEQSTHSALLTFWFMQAYLADLSTTRRTTPSFTVCQRILLKVQNIIFNDPPPQPQTPYGNLMGGLPGKSRFWKRKVKPRIAPAVVGLGSILAGAAAMPRLTIYAGSIAIEQGRVADDVAESRSVHVAEDEAVPVNTSKRSLIARETESPEPEEAEEGVDEEESDEEEDVDTFGRASTMSKLDLPEELEKEHLRAFSWSPKIKGATLIRRKTVGPSATSPSLLRHRSRIFKSEDTSANPSHSSPSVSFMSPSSPAQKAEDAALQKLDSTYQSQLLQSHYCRSEVQFLLALESISNRLLVVPKLARVSALRAELTALNHKLPAEIDIPMWTSDADGATTAGKNVTRGHNKIVRIPPGESVVLNSAERTPYLLLVEVLVGELGFNPSKRGNREVLRRLVLSEGSTAVNSNGFDPAPRNGVTSSKGGSVRPSFVDNADLGEESNHTPSHPNVAPSNLTFEAQEEEVDLVEQLYGADLSVRLQPPDLSDSIVLPLTPKNKALDIAAWAKAPSSRPPSPATHPAQSSLDAPDEFQTATLQPQTSSPHSQAFASHQPVMSLEDYSERMRTAAIMLAQLNANLLDPRIRNDGNSAPAMRMKLQPSEAAAIRDKIMQEMMALEEERVERMKETDNDVTVSIGQPRISAKNAEDETIVRRELNKVDPSAAVVRESWVSKKARIRSASPYGHLASWDCLSVIVKTGADLRQEQMAVQLIQVFDNIWKQESCSCWVKHFRILITGPHAVSVHSIKKAEYARRIAEGRFEHVTLLDHFIATYGDPQSAKFARAQRCFVRSLAGYSIITYLLQIKDRHNGNILLDREGHLVHIDFGFMLGNTPGNMGFEAAPFKLPLEYVEVLGGTDSEAFTEFKRLFREGFEAARKHCDSIITLVELMQKDSSLDCFATFGEQTSVYLRERFQQNIPHSAVGDYVDKLIVNSMGSAWTRLYDSVSF